VPAGSRPRLRGAPALGTLIAMCGIGGILRVTKPGEAYEPIPESWLDALDAGIAWRGPDGAGRFRDRVTKPDGTIVEVALVHRRLSIIDHEGGAQPMVSERGPEGEDPAVIVFNGCVYNHREIRARLERERWRFKTDHCDTEALLLGWQDSGTHLELNSMHAAVVWNRESGDIDFLRDWSGEKPLYKSVDRAGRCVAFASTIPALLALRAARGASGPAGLDPRGVREWIRFGASDRELPLEQIEMTLRGDESLSPDSLARHPLLRWWVAWAVVAAIVMLIVTPWLLLFLILLVPVGLLLWNTAPRFHTAPSISHGQVGDSLERAVLARLDADVPVGCFLSGGVDSSLVSLYAARHVLGIPTICMRMPDERYDESAHAEAIARIIGSEHVTVDVAPNAAEDLVHIIETLGLPFGDSSILPTHWLCRAAREHMKVALTGDGGDELFWGYDRYVGAARMGFGLRDVWRWWPAWLHDPSDPTSRGSRARRFVEACRGDAYLDLVSIFPSRELRLLLDKKDPRRHFWEKDYAITEARRARRWDLDNYLGADLLRKTDTASMLCHLELRCPMLDWEIRELADRAPAPALFRRSERKTLLRDLARRHFPADLIDRPKQGFAIPVGEWFRSDFGGMRTLLMDLVGTHAEANRPAFGRVHDVLDINMRYVDRMVREHTEERRDHSQRLFMLCSLAIWARWLDRG
jgi:asparagine synthase (glutamine-hydrolysing)